MKCAIVLRRFQRFHAGTYVTILGKPIFALLANVIYNQAL
jgi:hypothetical protein